jgi:threonine/homoserine/homoserine lactone efflux protein
MGAIELLLKGIAAGFAISAPVGPVNVLCVSRTITKGWLAGVISGLGAAVADTFYGSIAGFSISLVIGFLIREQSLIRLYGGILLVGIGIWYYFKRIEPMKKDSDEEAAHSDFVTTFLLTLTNPTTVLSFLAVLAVLGLSGSRPTWLTLILIGGILVGSMTWWVLLVSVTNHFRDRFNDRTAVWMNRIGGLAIGCFGVVMFVLGKKQ